MRHLFTILALLLLIGIVGLTLAVVHVGRGGNAWLQCVERCR